MLLYLISAWPGKIKSLFWLRFASVCSGRLPARLRRQRGPAAGGRLNLAGMAMPAASTRRAAAEVGAVIELGDQREGRRRMSSALAWTAARQQAHLAMRPDKWRFSGCQGCQENGFCSHTALR
ncbi:hypothetical protein [Chromobacterium violaceum]|uniref:hypothetical protein n=1 Tax=Chromobacterium violaceum TaxID=536 RepID=UPI00111BF659|nr:hypothetical protein [Chromobacterium violaceum]QRO32261.1 hypothetical protein I6K04_17490 [Chromobacterium violaceum]QRQ17938.1 hypothetical protein I6K03_05240 [Chromobacterium violaceum]